MSPVLPRDIVSRIKDETDIVEVVRQYVSLKPAGSAFKGLCPFHREKTPSFQVNPARQIYKCFGCGEGGDVLSFLMKLQGLSFPEALEILARPLNIDLARFLTDNDESEGERQAHFRATEAASELFVDALWSPAGSECLAYMRDRGFSDELLRRFEVGFAPGGTAWIRDGLEKKGVGPELALRAGLLKKRDQEAPFAYFRNRVIFPVRNVAQRIAGFGGRVLGQGEPKYLNSPESAYFNKRKLLYGFASTRIPIARRKTAILVEGYLDLMALAAAGFNNSVATCGTAFTREQAESLHRGCRTLFILYDGDKAGIKAAVRAGEVALAAGMEPRVARLPLGMDPDDFLGENEAAALGALLQEAPSWLELLHDIAVESGRGREGKERAIKKSLDALAAVEDPIRRELLLDELGQIHSMRRELLDAEMLRMREAALKRVGREPDPVIARDDTQAPAAAETEPVGSIRIDRNGLERRMLAHVLRDEKGVAAALMLELWRETALADPQAEALRQDLSAWQEARAGGEEVSPESFVMSRWHERDEAYRGFVTDLLAGHDELTGGDHAEEVRGLFARLESVARQEKAVAALRFRSRGLKDGSSASE